MSLQKVVAFIIPLALFISSFPLAYAGTVFTIDRILDGDEKTTNDLYSVAWKGDGSYAIMGGGGGELAKWTPDGNTFIKEIGGLAAELQVNDIMYKTDNTFYAVSEKIGVGVGDVGIIDGSVPSVTPCTDATSDKEWKAIDWSWADNQACVLTSMAAYRWDGTEAGAFSRIDDIGDGGVSVQLYDVVATSTDFFITGYSTGLREITDITCNADANGNLDGTFFTINSKYNQNRYYAWFDIIQDPNPGLVPIQVNINKGANANIVASATSGAIAAASGGGDFMTGLGGNVVTVTNRLNGVTMDAADVSVGGAFGILVTQQGAGPIPGPAQPEITQITCRGDLNGDLDGTHFTLNSANNANRYYVWYNVDQDPNPPNLIEINIPANMNDPANTIADKTQQALNALGDFVSANPAANTLTVVNDAAGGAADAGDGGQPTGFSFLVTQQGTGWKEVTKITCNNADPNQDGTYFTINSANDETEYYAWYEIIQDPAPGGFINIQVDIDEDDTANDVALATKNAIAAKGDFGATVTNNKVTITNANNGPVTATQDAGAPQNTGFNFNRVQISDAGRPEITDVTCTADGGGGLDGKYFKLYGYNGGEVSYYVWYNVDQDPAPAGLTEIKITIKGNDLKNAVADKTATALDALGDFLAPNPPAEIMIVVNSIPDPCTDTVDVDTAHAIVTDVQGEAPEKSLVYQWDGQAASKGTDVTPTGYPAVKLYSIDWVNTPSTDRKFILAGENGNIYQAGPSGWDGPYTSSEGKNMYNVKWNPDITSADIEEALIVGEDDGSGDPVDYGIWKFCNDPNTITEQSKDCPSGTPIDLYDIDWEPSTKDYALCVGQSGVVLKYYYDSADDASHTLSGDVANELSVATNISFNDEGENSIIQGQLDVETLYRIKFDVSDVNSWEDLGEGTNGEYIHFNMWFDGGNDANDYDDFGDLGSNYKIQFQYVDRADNLTPAADEISLASGNAQIVTKGVKPIITNRHYRFYINFTLGKWVRQADGIEKKGKGGDAGTGAFQNRGSWNMELEIYDGDNTVEIFDDGTNSMEFGVYNYNEFSVGAGNWIFYSGSPGEYIYTDGAAGGGGGYDYIDNFELGLGNWQNNVGDDDFDWTRDRSGTPTANTGPSEGARGTTWYMFIEADGNFPDKKAIFEGPTIDFSSGRKDAIIFRYHMYGANIGTLALQEDTLGSWNTIWSRTGNQGDDWKLATIGLGSLSGSGKLRFLAETGAGTEGDIAVDEIRIVAGDYPGGSAEPASFSFISNNNFDLRFFFEDDLRMTTDPTKTIPISSVFMDEGEFYFDATTFVGTGYGNSLDFLDSTSKGNHFNNYNNAVNPDTSYLPTFGLEVPVGTYPGTYTATMKITLVQG